MTSKNDSKDSIPVSAYLKLPGLAISYAKKNFREKPLKNSIRALAYGSLIGLFVTGAMKNSQESRLEKQLYEQTCAKADVNSDGAITSEEWAGVYKSLNTFYDANNPSELSISQMEQYLGKQD